jgi:ribosomal-protein-alanine N-acetyltransferase
MTLVEPFRLIACDARGVPVVESPPLDPGIRGHAEATAALYARVGFEPPFVGYIAVAGDRAVGGGAFVGPPREGVVEIAYYTQAAFEGRGYATRTARALVAIAHAAGCSVIAHTLMSHNASTRILGGLGFVVDGTAQDDDAGTVWRWRLANAGRSRREAAD